MNYATTITAEAQDDMSCGRRWIGMALQRSKLGWQPDLAADCGRDWAVCAAARDCGLLCS